MTISQELLDKVYAKLDLRTMSVDAWALDPANGITEEDLLTKPLYSEDVTMEKAFDVATDIYEEVARLYYKSHEPPDGGLSKDDYIHAIGHVLIEIATTATSAAFVIGIEVGKELSKEA